MASNLGYKVSSTFFHWWCKPCLILQPILRKKFPPWSFLQQACHLYGLMHLILLWIKNIQTIVTSLWLNSKFCIQTIPKTRWKFEVQCIVKICLILPRTYVPWSFICAWLRVGCSKSAWKDFELAHPLGRSHGDQIFFNCHNVFPLPQPPFFLFFTFPPS